LPLSHHDHDRITLVRHDVMISAVRRSAATSVAVASGRQDAAASFIDGR
jgi:hypothetical protein